MKTKKFLALLLSAIMCLSLFTYPVFAEETSEFMLGSYNINASIMEFKYTSEVKSYSVTLKNGTTNIDVTSELKRDDPTTLVIKPVSKLDLSKNYVLSVKASDGTTEVTNRKAFSFDVAWEEDFDRYNTVADLEKAGYSLRRQDSNPTSYTLSDANALDTTGTSPYVSLVDDGNDGKKLALRKLSGGYSFTKGASVQHWYVTEATIDANNATDNNRPNMYIVRDPYYYAYGGNSSSLYSITFLSYQTYISAFTEKVEGSNGNIPQCPAGKFDMVYDAKLPSADAESGVVSLYYNGSLEGRWSDIGKYGANSQLAEDPNFGTADTCKDAIGFMALSSNVQYIDNIRVYRVLESEISDDAFMLDSYNINASIMDFKYNGNIDTYSATLTSGGNSIAVKAEIKSDDPTTLVIKPGSKLDLSKKYILTVTASDGLTTSTVKRAISFSDVWEDDFDDYADIAALEKEYTLGNQNGGKTLSTANSEAEASSAAPYITLVNDGNGGKKVGLRNSGYSFYSKNGTVKRWSVTEVTIDPNNSNTDYNGNRPFIRFVRGVYQYMYEGETSAQYSIVFRPWQTVISAFTEKREGSNGKLPQCPEGKFDMVYDAKLPSADATSGIVSLWYNGSLAGRWDNLGKYASTGQEPANPVWGNGDECYDRIGFAADSSNVQYIDNIRVYRVVDTDATQIAELKETDRDITSQAIRINYSKDFSSTPVVTLKANGVPVEVTATKSNNKSSIDIKPKVPLDLYKFYELTVSNVSDDYGQSAEDISTKFKFEVYWDEDFESYSDITELDEFYEIVGYEVDKKTLSDYNCKITTEANENKKLQINKFDRDASFRKRSLRNREETLRYCTVEFTATSDATEGSFSMNLNRHVWSYPDGGHMLRWGYVGGNVYMIFGMLSSDTGNYLYPYWGYKANDEVGTQDRNTQVTVNMDAYDAENDKLSIFYDGVLWKSFNNKGKFSSYGNIGFSTGTTNTEYIDDIKVYDVSILADNKIYAMLTNNTVSNTAVSGNIIINNMTQNSETPMIIAVAYDANGALLNTQIISDKKVGTGISTIPYSVEAENAATVNVFVWTNGLKPLTDNVAYWQK